MSHPSLSATEIMFNVGHVQANVAVLASYVIAGMLALEGFASLLDTRQPQSDGFVDLIVFILLGQFIMMLVAFHASQIDAFDGYAIVIGGFTIAHGIYAMIRAYKKTAAAKR